MTMAKVQDGKVVEVGLPDDLKDATSGRLHHYGWRKIVGTPKPNPSELEKGGQGLKEGQGYEYGGPYKYDAEEDVVYGGWRRTNVKERIWREVREAAVMTRAEFKLALDERDELAAVEAAMNDSSADPRAVILWEDALHFHRTDPDLQRLATDLGYTEEQLDEIFGIISLPDEEETLGTESTSA